MLVNAYTQKKNERHGRTGKKRDMDEWVATSNMHAPGVHGTAAVRRVLVTASRHACGFHSTAAGPPCLRR
jgi:hypothetical protein